MDNHRSSERRKSSASALAIECATSNPQIAQRRMLKVPEAAMFVGVSVAYLNALRCKGGGPQFLKLGRAVLYDPTDLETWLSDKRRTSTSDKGGAK